MIERIVFDLDGTLFETGEGIKHCTAYALEKVGAAPLTDAELNKFIGPSLYDSFTQTAGLDEQTATEAIEIYRAYYRDRLIEMSRPYDGIEDMLVKLAKRYELAIASSKPLVMVEQLLKEYDFAKYFAAVIAPDYARRGSDKCELILTAAQGHKCVMVGDTEYDINGAHKAGVKAIGVTYGYGDISGADFIASSPEEVSKIIFEKEKEIF